MFETRKTRLLRRALALFAGDHVLSKLERDGERFLTKSAEPAILTMLFFRMDSVQYDESITFETIFEWQRAYAEAITRTFFDNQGIFDTFVGFDGSGWWNSKDQPEHADLAVESGLAIVKAVNSLNNLNASFPKTGVRVGIHTGRVGLGNFGSTIRLRYCPLGDAVNVAHRLSGATPYSANPLIVSGETYDLLKNKGYLSYLGDLVKIGPERVAAYGMASGERHAI